MDANFLVTAVSSIGFPIVCCYFIWKENTDILEKMRETIDNNTRALIEISAKIDAQNREGDSDV